MKISIITPSYNSCKTLERSIQSVLLQDYKNYEHIVVDGSSTDDTLKIIKKYPHLIWVSEPDRGQSHALNKGFRMSNGDIIVTLNADDYFLKSAFSNVMSKFKHNDKCIMGKVLVRSRKKDNFIEWVNDPASDFISILHHWEPNSFCVNPVGYFYIREIQENFPFNENNHDKQDLEFLLKLAKHYKIKKINSVLGVFDHDATTKTQINQMLPEYWNKNNFRFIDQYLKSFSNKFQEIYELKREKGYQLRRYNTILDAIERGIEEQLIDKGKIIFLPENINLYKQQFGTVVDFNHFAAEGDWVIINLSVEDDINMFTNDLLKDLSFNILPVNIYNVNEINDKTILKIKPVTNKYAIGLALKKLFDKRKNAFSWKIIIGILDPLLVAIDVIIKRKGKNLTVENIENECILEIMSYIRSWFDIQIKEVFNIDVFDYEFNLNKGYSIIKNDNIEILIYKAEYLLDNCYSMFKEFLGIDNYSFKKIKKIEKKYKKIYKILIEKRVYFNKEFLSNIYNHDICKKFYSDFEINRSIKRWLKILPEVEKPHAVFNVNVSQFGQFTYSKISHYLNFFKNHSEKLYGKKIKEEDCDLKVYQDLLVFNFIVNNLKPGARILEIGGGYSRILKYFSNIHECWNLDKFEGKGNGPKIVPKANYRIILDYIGNFNSSVPSNYFDFVFSISVLEHLDNNDITLWKNVIDDINRILALGGKSLHCIDFLIKDKHSWIPNIIRYLFDKGSTVNKYISIEEIINDNDLYFMSEAQYNKMWKSITNRSYKQMGKPASYNLLWIKKK